MLYELEQVTDSGSLYRSIRGGPAWENGELVGIYLGYNLALQSGWVYTNCFVGNPQEGDAVYVIGNSFSNEGSLELKGARFADRKHGDGYIKIVIGM